MFELRRLRQQHPELAAAVDLQVILIGIEARVKSRVPLPWVEMPDDWAAARLAAGQPMLRFEHLPMSWVDFRWVFRQITAALHRYETLDDLDRQVAERLVREPERLERLVRWWFSQTASPEAAVEPDRADLPEMIPYIIQLACRPFLVRCSEAYASRFDARTWTQGRCPLCGAEPEMALLTAAGERLLICSRCTLRWSFPSGRCPYCGDAEHQVSFASADRVYRIDACNACRRYVKAYDARRAERPLLMAVDAIATLPLDAAAQQKGYVA